MKTSSVIGALNAPENRKAVAIGITCGTAVVVGACAIKVAGLGLAGKIVIGSALAAASGYIVKRKLDDGALDAMLASVNEMSNPKAE